MIGKEKTIIVDVQGMFCENCEQRVRNAVQNIPGVRVATASFSEGQVRVLCAEWTSREAICQTIEELGYDVDATDNRNVRIVSILVILLAVYVIARHLGWTDIFHIFPAIDDSAGLGVLFLVGLLTSVHCIAMCGGINLAQSAVSAGGNERTAVSNLNYNLGRVISYTALGGVAGGIGKVFSLSGILKGAVTAAVGIVLLLLALRMLGVFKLLGRFSIHLPSGVYKNLHHIFVGRSSFAVGLLNGFMPCGPLQSMQIYAFSTGSISKGMLSMLAFSLGSVPLMFGFGFAAGKLQEKHTRGMLTVSALLIFLMGIHTAGNGLALAGMSGPSSAAEQMRIAVQEGEIQIVQTEIGYGSYEAITVKSGIPVEWTIYVPEGKLNGCNGEIIIPVYDLDVRLAEGENLVRFTPEKPGEVPYSCWMGMIKSRIKVV